jgi:hypothetical protein
MINYLLYHMTYENTDEFLDCYLNNTLNEFNTQLFGDYIDCNFDEHDFNDNYVDISYHDGCYCDNDIECNCKDDVCYYNDEFMWSKLPMFPKNMHVQCYYDKVLNKRLFNGKTFYYLPNGWKRMIKTYIDDNVKDTVDVYRDITYYFDVNDKLIMVDDQIRCWWGQMYNHQHIQSSLNFNKYVTKIKNTKFNEDEIIFNYFDN